MTGAVIQKLSVNDLRYWNVLVESFKNEKTIIKTTKLTKLSQRCQWNRMKFIVFNISFCVLFYWVHIAHCFAHNNVNANRTLHTLHKCFELGKDSKWIVRWMIWSKAIKMRTWKGYNIQFYHRNWDSDEQNRQTLRTGY